LAKLREFKLEENTIIFLISDNGGAYANAEMGGLRGHKWLCWEGGIRVSWIAAWKGHLPGGRVSHEPVIQLDVALRQMERHHATAPLGRPPLEWRGRT
jgi:arylsulfatase A-like enzyme